VFSRDLALALAVTGIVVGWWRGGLDGKVCAAVLTVALIEGRLHDIPAIDGLPENTAHLVIFLIVALRSRNYWTIWMAAVALLSVLTDLLDRFVGLTAWSYHSAQVAWAWAAYGILIAGPLLSPRAAPGARVPPRPT
jgi:hypothetical protein